MHHTLRTTLTGCALFCGILLMASCQKTGAPTETDNTATGSSSSQEAAFEPAEALPPSSEAVEEMPAAEKVPAIVARVNGMEISGKDYEMYFAQAQLMAADQGLDPDSEEARAQARKNTLDQLIGTKLLIEQSEKEAAAIAESEIETEYQSLVQQAGDEEAFAQQLAEAGLTEEGLRNDIRKQLGINQYLDQYLATGGTEVTEEDMRALYDEVGAGQENVPPYEEVKEQVRAELQQQQEQERILKLVEDLRSKADVEILF